MSALAVVLSAYLLSTLLVFPVRAAARRLGVIDRPGGRKAHREPVPLLGGLAIFGALLIVIWGSLYWLPATGRHVAENLSAVTGYFDIRHKLVALIAGAFMVTAVGILDDIRGIAFSAAAKLLGQIAAAAILLPAGIYMDLPQCSPWLSMLVSVIWVVGITNSFNLLDNMDGLSSGIALICACILFVLVMAKGEVLIALLLAAVIGSTLGFYQFNMRGSYLFMGDTGSLLLGYLLGSLSLMARGTDPQDASIFPVIAPVIVLGLPLFDTLSVIVIRLREGRSVFQGDQMHLSHRLVRIGMSTRQAVLFNYLMAFAIAVNALLMINSRPLRSFIAVVQVSALVAMVSVLIATQARLAGSGPSGAARELRGE